MNPSKQGDEENEQIEERNEKYLEGQGTGAFGTACRGSDDPV